MWELIANIDVLLYVLWAVVLVISAIIIYPSVRRRRRLGRDGDGQSAYGPSGDAGNVSGNERSARSSNSQSRQKKLIQDSDGSAAYEEKAASGCDSKIPALALALGGAGNIRSVGCSDTRLRIKVDSGDLVDKVKLTMTGALGVLAKDRQVQVFYEKAPVSLCRELAAYVRKHGKMETEDMEVDTEYERVLEKIFTPVEGDIVRLSDICHIQGMGDGNIGGFAVCAKRGEIRAPFDCEAGYREAGKGKIVCSAGSGVCVSFELAHDGDCSGKTEHNAFEGMSGDAWRPPYDVGNIRGIRLHFRDGERIRKGRLLAEFFPGGGDVYCIASVSCPLPAKLVVHPRDDVNYEHVACEVVG